MPCDSANRNAFISGLFAPEFDAETLNCPITIMVYWLWEQTQVAAKRARPNGGDQDFGFLSSGNEGETESAAVDFGLAESSSDLPAAAPDQFNTQVDSEHPDFEAAPADAVIPAAAAPPVSTGATATVKSTKWPSVKSAKSLKTEASKDSESAEPPPAALPEGGKDESKTGNSKISSGLLGYAIALTLLLLGLLVTGRLSLTANSVLESLPDLRPLPPNEFRRIEEGAELPPGHVLKLGESRRFGDVVVTPVKLTKEPLKFQGFLSAEINEKLTSQPLLKLWLNFESVADDYAYPPFDSGLMSNRTPPYSKDTTTLANSFLKIFVPSQDSATTRKLNYLHTLDNNFVIADQNSAQVLQPGESMLTFIAASENDNDIATDDSTQFVWRIQFRKGVNVSSGNGVTTLIDVKFSGADIEEAG